MTKPSRNYAEKALREHRKLRGKIEVRGKAPVNSPEALNTFYTPGVGAVASYLATHPKDVPQMTIKGNSVAIVSDGSAVLGLGNIGPYGALTVMEGKAMLFKQFAGIDAFPIVLNTQDPEEIVETVVRISPTFGGINLEDIAAPHCFAVEEALLRRLDIPVMHDDQHGTAVVVLAGLINSLKLVRKEMAKVKIFIVGAGAAGNAIAKLLHHAGARHILVLDRKGLLAPSRTALEPYKKQLAKLINPKNIRGELKDAAEGADVLVGVSGPGIVLPEHVRAMHARPIVLAMANPVPEIMPEEAKRAGAYIVATGRSDFPNQLNNALAFPGIFRGALDHGVKKITTEMKVRAAEAIAKLVPKPTPSKIIPSIFDPKLAPAVSQVIR